MDDISRLSSIFYKIISTLGQVKIMRFNSILFGAKKGLNHFPDVNIQ